MCDEEDYSSPLNVMGEHEERGEERGERKSRDGVMRF